VATREEAEGLIGRYIEFTWAGHHGSPGDTTGCIIEVYQEADGKWWAQTDWGHGARLKGCTMREVAPSDRELGLSRKDPRFNPDVYAIAPPEKTVVRESASFRQK
jgi:hypothetical protein